MPRVTAAQYALFPESYNKISSSRRGNAASLWVSILMKRYIFLLGHLAARHPAAVLDPARPTHRADARRLLEVREVFLRHCSEDEVRHISTADGTRLFLVGTSNRFLGAGSRGGASLQSSFHRLSRLSTTALFHVALDCTGALSQEDRRSKWRIGGLGAVQAVTACASTYILPKTSDPSHMPRMYDNLENRHIMFKRK